MKDKLNVSDTGFPARFDHFLKAFNLNTNRLATELNDSNPVKFRRWLAGEVGPAYDNLVQIALKYNIDMNWLALGEGSMLRGEESPEKTPNIKETVQEPTLHAPGLSSDEQIELIRLREKVELQDKLIEKMEGQIDDLRKDKDWLHSIGNYQRAPAQQAATGSFSKVVRVSHARRKGSEAFQADVEMCNLLYNLPNAMLAKA